MRDNGVDKDKAPAQYKLLNIILDYQEKGRSVPTYQELADRVGTTKSQVHAAVQRLIAKGYLKSGKTPANRMKTGTLEATDMAWDWRPIRMERGYSSAALIEPGGSRPVEVEGIVAAGPGRNIDDEYIGEYLSLPTQRVRGRDVFLLQIAGDSMAGDNLRDGDHIIVDPDAPWGDGDMVVVLDQGAATVKRVYSRGASFVLMPSNKDYKPFNLEPGWEHLGGQKIQGKVVGLVLWHIEPGQRGDLDESPEGE